MKGMSGHVSCCAVKSSSSRLTTSNSWLVLTAASSQLLLPFLYPFLEKRCFSAERHRKLQNHAKETRYQSDRRGGLVRRSKQKNNPGRAVITPGSRDGIHAAADALRAFRADVIQNPPPEPPQRPNIERHETPLFDVVAKSKRKRKVQETKLSASGRVSPLDYNPWAAMLATTVRSCSATGMRAPVGLMTGFGLVRHPEKEEDVYLIPSELADMEQIKNMGEATDHQSRRAPQSQNDSVKPGIGMDEPMQSPCLAHSEGAAEGSYEASKVPAKTRSPPVPVRIVSHLNLFKLLTLQMTAMEPGVGGFRTTRKAVQRLLPTALRIHLNHFDHYMKQRSRVESQIGSANATVLPRDSKVDMGDLEWQHDVAARSLIMMRERVVLSVKRVLQLESSKTQRRRVQLWSDDYLRDTDARSIAEQQPEPFLGDRAKAATDKDGIVLDHIPPDTSASRAAQAHMRTHTLREIQRSIFLHFGPYPNARISDFTTTLRDSHGNRHTESYLPPMLLSASAADNPAAANNPFIPLLPLLGAEQHATLRAAVLQRARTAELTICGDISSVNDGNENESFTLVIKASAWHADSVFRELWQLWRYVGGRAALDMWEAGIAVDSPAVVGDPRLRAEGQGGA